MDAPWILLPLLFPLFFLFVWCSALWIIAAVSGWRRLARHFAEERPFLGETLRLGSARFRAANYSGVLTVGADASGLYLVPMRIFRAFHRPLLIPWSEIQTDAYDPAGFRRLSLTFPAVAGCSVILFGQAADLAGRFSVHRAI